MQFVNRAKETTSTTGTGALTLTGAVTGFHTISAKVAVGVYREYWIWNQTTRSEFEYGIGKLTDSTHWERTVIIGGVSGTSAVNFTTGTKHIGIDISGETLGQFGKSIKQPVRLATAAALAANTYNSTTKRLTATANAALTVDGVSVAVDNRILVKDESTGSNRGIYKVIQVGSGSLPYILERTLDAWESADFQAGMFVAVAEGTVNADKTFLLSTNDTITLDTTSLTFLENPRLSDAGYQTIRKTAAPADGDVATSELAEWWKNTVDAEAVVFKGKNSAGTVKGVGIGPAETGSVNAQTRKLAIYDGAGTLLGYVPVYSVVSHTDVQAVWKLNESSGSGVDSHGSNTLTDNNTVTSATGKIDGARQFTAANSESLTIADNASLSAGNIDYSIATWVYLDSKGADRVICAKGQSPNEYEHILRFDAGADRFKAFFYHNGSTATAVTANNLGSPSTGTWYFIVIWHDATADTINIQVNNGTADSAAFNSAGMHNGTGDFALGKQGSDNADYWDGRIDETVVAKRLFTAAEKTAMYNGGNALGYPW